MEWAGWAVAAVLGAVAFVRTVSRSQASGVAVRKYPNKDRGGMAFVIKDDKGRYKVAGGPKNHVAQPTEKVIWSLINASDREVTVVFEFTPSPAKGAPPSPFREGNGPHKVALPARAGNVEKLTLKVLDRDAFPDVECDYQYSVRLEGIADSELDPELDIWP